MINKTDNERELYTSADLRQAIHDAVENVIIGYEASNNTRSGKTYKQYARRIGIAPQRVRILANQFRGTLNAIPTRKIKRELRKIHVEVDTDTVKVTVGIIVLFFLLGVIGEREIYGCLVSGICT